MRTYVLDASALIAVLLEEEGAEEVIAVKRAAVTNAVNASEATARLIEHGMPLHQASRAVLNLQVPIIAFDEDLAWRTADLRRRTKGIQLSLADRACLATAERLGATAVTADRVWRKLKLGVAVQMIR